MKKLFANIPLAALVIIFLFLRLYHFEDALNFGSDQGTTLLETYNLYKAKKLTLIGFTGSSWTTEGRYIFFSSVPYYLLMPILLLFAWQPIPASYFFIFLQLVSFIIIYKVIESIDKKTHKALFFSLLFAFSPILIEYSRFVWTPNLLIPISGMLLALGLLISKKKNETPRVYTCDILKYGGVKSAEAEEHSSPTSQPGSSAKADNKSILVFLLGFLSGLGFGMHYSFTLAIILLLLWMIAGRKFSFKEILIFIISFILAFSPLIVFELRHDFYNYRTLLFILSRREEGSTTFFTFNDHYWLPLIPFIIYAACLLLVKLERLSKFLAHFLIAVYLIYSLYKILPVPEHGFRMVSGWNYKGIKRASEIILSENRQNYNIVDILTGDSRAMALRYLLTISGKSPMGVIEYPQAKYLFIYSKVPFEQIFRGSMWEIDVIKPEKLIKKWHLSNGIYLYLVEKKKL